MYRRVCSWCLVHLDGPEDAPVSHGVCPPCRKALLPRFLDTLKGAVFLVGQDARILSANAAAQDWVGRPLSDIEGAWLGDLCPDPQARRAVEETLTSGTEYAEGLSPVSYSTRRVRQGVLLQVYPGCP